MQLSTPLFAEAKLARDEVDLYAALLEAIDCGDYPPGGRLIETELADRFGVSRTPIREVLNRLESQGVAQRDGRRGLTVAKLDYDQLGELYEIRELLEGYAARLAARRASNAEIAVLQEMVDADRGRAADPAALALSNRRFHRQMHLASHNRYLNQMLQAMRRSLALLSGTTLGIQGRGDESVAEHQAIVDAIGARDENAAEGAARQHILNAYKARLRMGAD
ncbi:GntR family transcriptional regulator [Rhodobacteraceae bacterium NNCM2]|nr:GntR family transcriptional regulator [Coraliihabitans acroporae]